MNAYIYSLSNRHNAQCLILFDKNRQFWLVCLLLITSRVSQTNNLNIHTVPRVDSSADQSPFVKQRCPFELALFKWLIWFKTKTFKEQIRLWSHYSNGSSLSQSNLCNRLDKRAGKSSRLADHVTDWSAGEASWSKDSSLC